MKNLKNILALALVVVMALSLCACGETAGNGNESTAATTTASTQQTTEATEDDGKITYTVTVVDEGGNPVSGAMVQLCDDKGCNPKITDENGVATYDLVESEYHAIFSQTPEGYAEDTTEYYFEDGSYELTITLKAVA